MKQAMTRKRAVCSHIEKALARASTKRAESADPDKRYHVLSLADLEKLAPDFDFSVYLNQITTRPIETLNVANPDYLKAVDQLISSVPIDSWKSYFRWRILSAQAVALPKEFRDEDLPFGTPRLGAREADASLETMRRNHRWAFGEALRRSG
jgi:putative endopeptidase